MIRQPIEHREPRLTNHYEPDSALFTWSDAIRFLYQRRLDLLGYFSVFFVIGLSGLLVWYVQRPKIAEGIVSLTFEGIERGEYPHGKTFSMEDLRAPSVLAAVNNEIDLGGKTISNRVMIEPIIPGDVQLRWKRQDQAGNRRDPYFPNDFRVRVDLNGLSDQQGLRAFDALVEKYRGSVLADRAGTLVKKAGRTSLFDELVSKYEYVDIPVVLEKDLAVLNANLDSLVTNNRNYTNLELQMGFDDLKNALTIWSLTHLDALKAAIYRGGLVKDRNKVLSRMRYQLDEANMRLKIQTLQLADTSKLLGSMGASSGLAKELPARGNSMVIDSSVVELIRKTDQALVQKISELQERKAQLEQQRLRLEREIPLFQNAANVVPAKLPSEYRQGMSMALKELETIISNYEALLTRYQKDVISNLITVKQGPTTKRDASSMKLLAVQLVLLSGLLSLVAVCGTFFIRQSLGVRAAS